MCKDKIEYFNEKDYIDKIKVIIFSMIFQALHYFNYLGEINEQ